MNRKNQNQSVNKPQTVSLDIMKAKGTLFYKTLSYTFTPPICMDALVLWIVNQLPSLSGKSFVFFVNDVVNGEKVSYRCDVSS